MPPVIKYSKEKVIEIGLELVKEEGIEKVSARNVAKKLGSSICPVFSCFETMDDLKQTLLKEIYKLYVKYLNEGMLANEKVFKGAGLAYIKFARENKNYFKALFMGKNEKNIDELIRIDKNNDNIKKAICESTKLSEDDAVKLHQYNWVFVHGIAVMLAMDYCVFSDDEISEMLSFEYQSLLHSFRRC